MPVPWFASSDSEDDKKLRSQYRKYMRELHELSYLNDRISLVVDPAKFLRESVEHEPGEIIILEN